MSERIIKLEKEIEKLKKEVEIIRGYHNYDLQEIRKNREESREIKKHIGRVQSGLTTHIKWVKRRVK